MGRQRADDIAMCDRRSASRALYEVVKEWMPESILALSAVGATEKSMPLNHTLSIDPRLRLDPVIAQRTCCVIWTYLGEDLCTALRSQRNRRCVREGC